MNSIALLVTIYIAMVILGCGQVEGGRPAKRPTYYDLDESDMFERMADQDYQMHSNSHITYDNPMDAALDTSDLDMNFDYRMERNRARSQRKSQHKSHLKSPLKFPKYWAK